MARAFEPGPLTESGYESMPLAGVSRKASEGTSGAASIGHVTTSTSDPGAVAVAAGLAIPDGNGSVVFRMPSGDGATGPSIQRQDEAPAAISEPTTPTPTTGETAPRSKQEIEALASQLEETMVRRLRQRLLHLRERRGKLADL
jgi:hypothetical protein